MATDLVVKLPALVTQVTIDGQWLATRDSLVAQVTALSAIASPADYARGEEILKQITRMSNTLESMRKDFARPFQDAAALIKEASDKARTPMEQAKSRLQDIMATYWREQKRKEAAEAKRQEDEKRKEIEKQQAEHQAAIDAGLVDEDEDFNLAPPSATVPTPPATVLKSSGTSMPERVIWEVIDEDKVSVEFKSIDQTKVNAWKKLNEDRIKKAIKADPSGIVECTPGIKFKIEIKPRSSGR
jgi:hypothetical protein